MSSLNCKIGRHHWKLVIEGAHGYVVECRECNTMKTRSTLRA